MRGKRHTGKQMRDVDNLVSEIQELVREEPWRSGQGQPLNALDPTWSIERSIRCDGEVEYEAGSTWWWCKKCGYCGNHGYQHVHRPVRDPIAYLVQSANDFVQARVREGMSGTLALRQLAHVVGVAIRYAAARKSADLGDYVRRLIVP